MLEEIAQAVAVEDKTLRDRIYAKCMEKFDGETNVLWQQLEADANLKSKGGWSKKVDSELGKGRKNVVVKGIGNVDVAIKKFEKIVNAPLHLFWMYPSTWDKKATPLVAFVPFDTDFKTRQSIPAFDSKGNRFELDRKGALAKQRPIIVVAVNERAELDGRVHPNLLSSSSTPISPSMLQSLNPTRKNGAILQNGFYPTRVSLRWAYVDLSKWSDPDGEWNGSLEAFYLFECGNTWDNSNVWLGGNVGAGWGNKNFVPQSQGGNVTLPSHPFTHTWGSTQKVRFTFFERDFLWFDDRIESHEFSNPGISHPNTDNTPTVLHAVPARYVFHQ
ncbi:MAG: hypothetical protein ACOVSW_04230 [Candidatus Kapaibacteriota bacterium]